MVINKNTNTSSVARLNCNFKAFTKVKAEDEDNEDKYIYVKGLASTDDLDRHNDIVPSKVWNSKALKNFKKNPILLYSHNYSKVIGQVTSVTKVDNGLEVEARIYKKWDESYLVEDEVLKTFSIGFIIHEAEYKENDNHYLIKQVELLEVSIVSVPANGAATFQISKQLDKAVIKSFTKKENNSKMKEIIKSLLALIQTKMNIELDIAENATDEAIGKSLVSALEGMKGLDDQLQELLTTKTAELNSKIETLETDIAALKAAAPAKEGEDTNDEMIKIKSVLLKMNENLKAAKQEREDLIKGFNAVMLGDDEVNNDNPKALLKKFTTRTNKKFEDEFGNVKVEAESTY